MGPRLYPLLRGWRAALLSALLVALTGLLSLHWVCNLLYRCGCRPLWSSAHCNIHVPDVPHCPWCGGDGHFALVLVLLLLPAVLAGGGVAAWARRLGPGYLAGVGVYGLCAALLGWYFGA